MMNVSISWLANAAEFVCKSPLKNVVYEFILTSSEVLLGCFV